MKTLEILTAQNVTIDYQLASLTDRGIALVLDLVFIFILAFTCAFVLSFVVPLSHSSLFIYTCATLIFGFYALISDIVGDGQSWGKRIMGLKVVKINGSEARMSDYLVRWGFRSIDIYLTFGSLGLIMINSSPKSQRLGDMLSNTAVVKIKPDRRIVLANIEGLKDRTNHTIVYKEVAHMNEKEMLLLKTTLEQVRKHPNRAHFEALDELTMIMQERLRIKKQEKTNREFIQSLINDYIVMTR